MTLVAQMVDHTSDAAFAIDGNTRIVAWNDGARRLLGYEPEQAVGRFCYDILQAVLPGGEPLCNPDCEAASCFGRCQPVAIPSCRARHIEGHYVALNVSTIAVPAAARPDGTASTMGLVLLRADNSAAHGEPSERALRVFTFNQFALVVGGKGVAIGKWQRKQAITLLKYLVAHVGSPIHRERLIDFLWPDASVKQGRERLKVTVCFLRRKLRAAGAAADLLETVGSAYVLRADSIWVDSKAYERLITQGSEHQRRREFDQAIHCFEQARFLYRGDYMSDEPFADWCAEERSRLLEVHLDLLARLSGLYADQGDNAKAAQACRAALVHEPCRESFHRELMEILVRLGRSDWAIAQFHRCKRLLADEIGVEPMPETCRVYDEIVASRNSGLSRLRKSN